ncbi:DUF6457 domain-containing protein [uncultured Tessaracoccus sp.]|uniref:DUF6457 domain-containing protein n=1 Tax=uncultured Tessaracoccus sp. TaxID=905023 RepID=UPI0025E22F60|nr:DUF6457 domain-containing protein [uncultured Tessaracoccus sp.]
MQQEDRSGWRPFIERACAALDVDPALVDEDRILDLTATIAHDGIRPRAPVAAYVLGLATARGDVDQATLVERLESAI